MFEIVTTTRTKLEWRSDRGKTRATAKHLLDEIGYMIHFVKEHGVKGYEIRPGIHMGINKNQYLIEKGIVKPIIRTDAEEEEWGDGWQVTSLQDLEAAYVELQMLLAQHAPTSQKQHETV
jgi:hypothetical protein